jgi:hypothetical protein
MKRSILTLLLLLMIANLSAISQIISKSQLPEILTSEDVKLKSVIYQDFSKMGMKETYRIEYDLSDTLKTSITYNLKMNDWVLYSKDESFYSGDDRYQYIYYRWSDDGFYPSLMRRYEYNESGKLVTERRYKFSSTLEYRKKYELKENGDTLRIIYEEFLDGDSTIVYSFENTEYFYNTNDKIEKITIEFGYHDSVYTNQEILYDYEELKTTLLYHEDGNFIGTMEYLYDENGFMIEQTDHYMNKEGEFVGHQKINYEYDQYGNILYEGHSYWHEDTEEWKFSFAIFNSYNEKNELIETIQKNSKLDNIQKISITRNDEMWIQHEYSWRGG